MSTTRNVWWWNRQNQSLWAPHRNDICTVQEDLSCSGSSQRGDCCSLSLMEEKGIVSKEALVLMIKKSGKIRRCLDARELIRKWRMITCNIQLSTNYIIFRRIGHKKYFTILDTSDAFWQIPLKKESRRSRDFCLTVRPKSSTGCHLDWRQWGIFFHPDNEFSRGDARLDTVIVYLINVLITSESLKDHLRDVEEVLERLYTASFKLNWEKCEFFRILRFLVTPLIKSKSK